MRTPKLQEMSGVHVLGILQDLARLFLTKTRSVSYRENICHNIEVTVSRQLVQ